MGNSNQRTIFYIGASVAVLFLMALWPAKKSSSFLGFSAWKNADRIEQEDDRKVTVSPFSSPRSRWKSRKPIDGKSTTNDYQPGQNYVNSYVPNTEYQHPLVASTTFVNKKDKKKNKAKKKKEELAKTSKDSQSLRRFGLSETSEDDSLPPSAPPAAIGATASAANNTSKNMKNAQEEEEENLNSLEYWEEPIFVDLNTGMVGKLIESYQGRKVSAGVFYELVTEMRTDERTQVREFGLVALSATPSTRSFAELASMKNTDTDTNLRNAASREVANYYQEARLSHLISALSIKNAEANRPTFEALAVLNDATKKYSGESTQNTDGPTPVSATASATVDARFEQALSAIEQNKLTESPDSRIKNQAVLTQGSLEKFLTATL